jgi:uncharacterized iron-regulated membrane protein
MYRGSRVYHRWAGVFAALFLLIIAATGLLLALKARLDWMRPPIVEAQKVEDLSEVLSVASITEAAIAEGNPNLRSVSDIDRIDYRPRHNIFKVLSREGYVEMQVCGATGAVLSTSFRADQFTEDIHDLSFFAEWIHALILPLVAILLFSLAATGIGMFFTPVVRRWRFRKRGPPPKPGMS